MADDEIYEECDLTKCPIELRKGILKVIRQDIPMELCGIEFSAELDGTIAHVCVRTTEGEFAWTYILSKNPEATYKLRFESGVEEDGRKFNRGIYAPWTL